MKESLHESLSICERVSKGLGRLYKAWRGSRLIETETLSAMYCSARIDRQASCHRVESRVATNEGGPPFPPLKPDLSMPSNQLQRAHSSLLLYGIC